MHNILKNKKRKIMLMTLIIFIFFFTTTGVLYAKYLKTNKFSFNLKIAARFNVTLDANGGTIPAASSDSEWTGSGNTASKAVQLDYQYGNLPIPERYGYIFNGWVSDFKKSDNIPIDYQEVQYIQGNGKQYINTGYYPKANTKVELKVSSDDIGKNDNISLAILGARTEYDNVDNFGILGFQHGIRFDRGKGLDTDQSLKTGISSNIKEYTLVCDKGKNYINGKLVSVIDKQYSSTNYPIYLFGINQSNEYLQWSSTPLSIYYMRIWEDDTLIRDYIPCYNTKNHTIGMYDKVNQKFYTNEGTSTFEKGEDVEVYRITSDTVVQAKSDHRIYAKWLRQVHITFNSNDDSAKTTEQYLDNANDTDKLTENAFSRIGYTFTGWNTSSDGTGTSYNDKENISNLSTDKDGNITLYAQWLPNQYTVKFDVNGGDKLETTSKVVTYNSEYGSLPVPTKDGYTFQGWTTSALPTGYTELEYIESTNDGGQYINTNWCPNADTNVEMKINIAKNETWIYGARDSYTSDNVLGVWTTTFNNFIFKYGLYDTNRTSNISYTLGKDLILKNKKNTLFIDGKEDISMDTEPSNIKTPLYLFTINNGTNGPDERKMVGKIYYVKIWDQNTLVRDFIPCKNPEGIIGFYDMQSKNFYSNANNSTNFKGGSEVKQVSKLIDKDTIVTESQDHCLYADWKKNE